MTVWDVRFGRRGCDFPRVATIRYMSIYAKKEPWDIFEKFDIISYATY